MLKLGLLLGSVSAGFYGYERKQGLCKLPPKSKKIAEWRRKNRTWCVNKC